MYVQWRSHVKVQAPLRAHLGHVKAPAFAAIRNEVLNCSEMGPFSSL
jgi:hypothetical protein